MTRLLKSLIIVGFLLFTNISVEAQNHPGILVHKDDKQNILSKIEDQAWAKELYGKMLEKIEPIAERHTKKPDWILSRYQMYRVPKLEEFPDNDTSYEMFLQSTAPSGKWYWTDPQTIVGSINGAINSICLEYAIIYWLTGEEKYAKLAGD